jgi:formylglycine-generating enzyme
MHRLAALLLSLSCADPAALRGPSGPGAPDDPSDTGETDPSDTDLGDTDQGDTGDPPLPGACGPDTVLIDAAFCIDRFEARLEAHDGSRWVAHSPYHRPAGRYRAVPARGQAPQGYLSGVEADAACREAGKRLCTSAEWLRACRGAANRAFPYGDTYAAGACNDRYAGTHPVVDYFGTSQGVWDMAHMNDPGINQQPGTVASGGAFAACATADGVHDLHGNLHEWVADTGGTFRGGFYADGRINGVGCSYATTAHGRGYHDYSTGFRCCANPE